MTELSNTLADLAECVKLASEASALAEMTTIDKALEAGSLLCQAKDACKHGEWLPFLERAGVGERQARRLMQISRSGLKSDTVSDLGGIKGALAFISKRNAAVEMLSSIANINPATDDPTALIALHVERTVRLRKTLGLIGDMCSIFSDETKEAAPSRETASVAEGHPMAEVVAAVWSDVDAALASGNLAEAYIKLKAALLHCYREPSEEAYLIVRKASGIVLDHLETTGDIDALFKVSNDDRFTALAGRVDDVAKAAGWLQ
ncbi:DUF3102 domain-containing protein [Rhizobium sp. P32RR-XVIII]|uniref:DUF3102 domain-containing protein n=1 Tax=Rhizobium sp. P32RR-XVIII TaxID=2726738 RepID=UPI00145788DD|nr:DUF3102 domain-containing protein [Rhizobium sp. P32RR-XVIII]NLS07629.1 DUF3102 domain-containing protein [Rhizobium sp. P32RR-XVIII]